jgi:phenylpyruvate tautomerase PptA (4-oxalocrotonate tautomerase family)
MPICFIEGPSGLPENSKKELVEKTLESLVKAYQMPDDRVFIRENAIVNTGHTHHSETIEWRVQSENARPVCIIQAPQGLPLEARRILMAELTSNVAATYGIKDRRDILIFIQEYPLDVVGNNGVLQSENPEFASPATEV